MRRPSWLPKQRWRLDDGNGERASADRRPEDAKAPTARAHRALRIVSVVASVVVLQVCLAAYHWLPAPASGAVLAPTWELLGVVAVLLAIGRLEPRDAAARAVRGLLTVAIVVLTTVGLAEGFVRREFGYGASLALNVGYVPELVRTVYRSETPSGFFLGLALLVVAIAIGVATLHLALARLAKTCRDPVGRRWLGGGVAAYAAVAALTVGFGAPVSRVVVAEIDFAAHQDARLDALGDALERDAVDGARVPLAIGDVRPSILIFVVESYGNLLLLDRDHAPFREFLAFELDALRAAGYTARSRYYDSPVFGGSSWMANASLLCGVRIDEPKRYAALYHSGVRCLPRVLNDAGYHTVRAAGNSTFVDEAFVLRFPYDRNYTKDTFGYAGPKFSWSNMPDQYVIDAIDRREVAVPRPEPLFVYYTLGSSHFPWREIPPYLEDWGQVGDGSIFHRLEPLLFRGNSARSSRNFHKAYPVSIRYSLRAVFDYLASLPADRTPLIVVLGDHQPRRPLADPDTDPWWVPVHILSRDPALVDRFAPLGYVPGLEPTVGVVVGLERFVDDLTLALRSP